MKKFFILILFITGSLYSNTSNAQAYLPLLENNKFWDVTKDWYDGNFWQYQTARYFAIDDTIVNFKTYKKIYSSSFISGRCDTIKHFTNTYIREDTLTKKVYYLGDGYSSWCYTNDEILLYDFNYLPGDTLKCYVASYGDCAYGPTVDSIGSEFIYGLNRKVIYFSDGSFNLYEYRIVEGIGGYEHGGLFLPMYDAEYGWYRLACVGYIGNVGACSAFITNTQLINNSKNEINAYYDISNKNIKINDININEKISIYNVIGIELLSTIAKDSNMNIDVNYFAKGIYIIKAGTFNKKIIIN